MNRLLANWYLYIYDNMFSLNGISDQLTTYSDAITGALSDEGLLHSAYIVMRTLGVGMLVVYFIITLGTRLQGNNTSPAIFFKSMLEFFVGYMLAMNSFDIVRNMFLLGDSMAKLLERDSSVGESLDAWIETFSESIANIGILYQVLYALKALLPYLASVITTLFITYVIVTRVLRICVNAAMSPIAVANYFEGSRKSDSIRFLKRTAAMCLQCSMIMVIVAGVRDLSAFMSNNTVYSEAMDATETVEDAKNEMLSSVSGNISKLATELKYAADKKGPSAHYGPDLTSEYNEPIKKLLDNCESTTEDMEAEFKQYENLLGIEIFEREGDSYVYEDAVNLDSEHPFESIERAKLKGEYMIFTEEATTKFMDAMLGNNSFIVLIMLLAVKVGMIKQSMSFCNTVMGV